MSHPSPGADPSSILGVATGYMAAKQLFAASETGVFAALADGPATATEIAGRAGLPQRTARILADTMAALGLLTREDGRYANTPATAAYLAGDAGGIDLRPFLAFLDAISYPHWLGFAATTRSDKPQQLDMAGERMQTFMTGVMTYNALHARMLAENFDFTSHSRILDFGGLSGSFLIEALKAADKAHGTFLGPADFTGFATTAFEEAGLGERTAVVEADPLTGELPDGFDCVLMEHVVHRFDAEQNKTLIERARQAAAPGAKLVLLDFFLDEDPEQRLIDALHAGEYLVIDGTVVYPEAEVRGWLTDAGWEPVETRALPGSPRIIIAEAR
ncbi:polyketide biosynthesis methyltransferase [Actinomadura spongiicola]|uniref:Polyketide biosynthesis methyltransferase n=1 Tax=Actinomadura spongiicola TaxID=2303421 RepID=A0A372GB01_9ACTN|nr:methyltransferase dimerization domain-containing protein [Actinomadura spongiicola]RFS82520.1 polyketide biosynthesis methyltransferase [Actinomadura spongiicola]